jgi:flagella basal body P-ring formation protein FlgA
MPKQLLKFWIASTIAVHCTSAMQVDAASLLLRERSKHSGAIVYLGDVADISAATDAEVQNLVTTPLLAAPAAGTLQFLPATQLRDLLASRGIDVSQLSITGVKTIEIGKAPENKYLLAIEPVRQLTSTESEAAVIEAIKQHLTATTGHTDWQVDLDLKDADLRELAKLGTEIEARAGRIPWTGTQRFQLASVGSVDTVPVLARVDRLRYVIVTLRKVERGNLIGAGDVEVRLQGGNVPTTALNSLDQVIGKEALRTLDLDTIVQGSQVRAPLQVKRGETVKVVARTAGITVSTFAVVQQDGSLGDLVLVQTLDKKDRFAARVSGWKELEVSATGATTGDFASLNRSTTQKR